MGSPAHVSGSRKRPTIDRLLLPLYLSVGGIKRTPNAMKIDRRSIYTIVRPHTKFNPFREHFPATYKILFRTCRRRVPVCLGSERTMDGTRRPGRMQVLKTCRCNADDDMARCNTQANDMATPANNWKTPGTMVSGRYSNLLEYGTIMIMKLQIKILLNLVDQPE